MDHELALAARAEEDKHAIAMRKNPDTEHADPNARRVAPGGTAAFVWKAVKSGDKVTFEADRINGQITVTKIRKAK